MAQQTEEKKEDVLYKADPLTFIFRELDLMRSDIRELKSDTKEEFTNINRRIDNFMLDVNRRFDTLNESINKRLDDVHKRLERLYLVVILNLIGILAFLIKTFFF
ncbi:MAG: hypothetical protein Fur0020_01230 [Thermodesulfovibrionia bacterium]